MKLRRAIDHIRWILSIPFTIIGTVFLIIAAFIGGGWREVRHWIGWN